ncbi:MAG TPA: AbrB/MazE/SpoVT family DNA-binding domain-containing protein [Terriglobales bacterium]|jgi:AbrB family looped-hinge helix DNA binding protein|nr:AbrB/MazE/SpoVT family DNA-binding domain-containing protein [Terriglobales bacterium]
MAYQSRITSKGQITVPVEIRRKLGLRRGDRVEFREHGTEALITRAMEPDNPFDKYVGILRGKQKPGMTSKEWMAKLRDDSETERKR